jgi:hypothetical protein
VEYTKYINERLNVKFTSEIYSNKSDGPNTKEDSRHLNISPALNYRLTENNYLQLGYSYELHQDLGITGNPEYERNRIWIDLTFNFPDKL